MKKLKCAILDDYQKCALSFAPWSKIESQVEVFSFSQHIETEEELVAILQDFEIIILMRERTHFSKKLLSRLPNLKLLITSGMRNASIDLNSAKERGVTVCGTASSSEPPTELTWALILALARNVIIENHSFQTNGPWQSTIGADLFGKQLGVLGLGKIGTRVARIGQAFGMKVVAWSPNLTQERAEQAGVHFAPSKEVFFKTSDFISIHMVLSEKTKGLVRAEDLKKMRPTAYLINTSREQIIESNALIQALQQQWVAGAGVDVFENEPLEKNHLLRTLPGLLATPHLGYVSRSNYEVYYREAVENIESFLEGTPKRVL